MKGESNDGSVQSRFQISMVSFSLFGVTCFWWKNCAVLFACLADTMPQTVAGKSTTAKVMWEEEEQTK